MTQSEEFMLRCPACGQTTQSMKRFRLYNLLVFLFLAWWAQTATYTACPDCMRGILIKRTLINIIPANAVWPIVLVIHSVQFLKTFSSGHSRSVLQEVGVSSR